MCPDIHNGLYIEKQSESTADLAFCCQQGKIDTVNFIDFNHNEKLNFFRQHTNTKLSICKSCWQVEDHFGYSKRQSEIDWYLSRNISPKDDKIITLDYNTDNTCNLACVTCGPKFSSRWAAVDNTISPVKLQTRKNTLIDSLDLSEVRRVYFNGGEPLLTNDHITVLNKIKQQGNLSLVDISYNTNATIPPNEETLELWKQVRLVKLYLSIDSIESAFEFIRWPASWAQVVENINFIKCNSPNTMFDITFTLGAHNIFQLDDTILWYEQYLPTNGLGDAVMFNLQLCGGFSHGGKVLSLQNLSVPAKQLALRTIAVARKYNFWPGVEKILLTNSDATGDIVEYLDKLSSSRKIDWRQQLPLLYQAIK